MLTSYNVEAEEELFETNDYFDIHFAGYLCDATPEGFATALRKCTQTATAADLGQQARQRVLGAFSRAKFGAQLERYIRDML